MAAAQNINSPINSQGRTQFYKAVVDKNLQKVKELIAAGADVNKGRMGGFTPLFAASQFGHLEIVKELLAAGADVNKASNAYNYTPLYYASKYGHLEIVKALIKEGANVNTVETDENTTPLFIACEQKYVEIVTALLEAGADINIPTYMGKSVLQHAKNKVFPPETANLIILQESKPIRNAIANNPRVKALPEKGYAPAGQLPNTALNTITSMVTGHPGRGGKRRVRKTKKTKKARKNKSRKH
jgi:ankyrin repeat protein